MKKFEVEFKAGSIFNKGFRQVFLFPYLRVYENKTGNKVAIETGFFIWAIGFLIYKKVK